MPNTQPTANHAVAKPPGKAFILVAEDDQFYANIYRVKLAKEGYDVTVVGNGKWVLSAAKQRKPDLILLDLVMPLMDGFETLKALKKDPSLADINVIVLSNLGQDEDIATAKSLGAKDYLIKANNSIQEVVVKIKHYVG